MLITTTDAFGAYSFPKVAPGTWTLVATLRSNQLEDQRHGRVTDWIVPVAVPINGVGVGDFAAAGSKSLTGLLETATGERITCGVAEILWSGLDGILDTNDDMLIQVRVAKDGSFGADGVPGGAYRISGTSCAGKQAAERGVQLVKKTANVKLVVAEKIPTGGTNRNQALVLTITALLAGLVLLPARKRN